MLDTVGAEIRPAGGELGGGDEDSGAFARPRPWANYDFDVAVERVEEVHEALDREAFKTVVGQGGDLGLIDFQAACGGCLRRFLRLDAVDHDGELNPRLLLVGIG